MGPPHYRMVRLNTREHSTRALAFADMVAIVQRGSYRTQNDDPPTIPLGASVVGMGSHGGRGLYLHGVVAGRWTSTGELPFRHKLPVTWAHAVYDVPGDPEEIGALVALFNSRSWSRLTADDYRSVLDRVLAGTALPLPDEA